MIENVQYYGAAVQAGTETSVLTFAVRGMLGPFAHPLFTSMFGIGLGYAREGHGHGSRVWAPLLGFALAMTLHALWNLAASFDGWFFVGYLLVMVPSFLGVLILIHQSLRREGRIIRSHLEHLVHEGLIAPDELDRLCRVRKRLGASFAALRSGGWGKWRRRRELHRTASELAFHRWRVMRGLTLGPDADARREAEYLHRLRQLCRPGDEL
jgi:protease PrsW